MMNSSLTHCVNTYLPPITDIECYLTRFGATIIFFVALFSIYFNIRFLYWSYHHKHIHSHHFSLVLSMFFSSFFVISITVPSVLVQCFTCHRWCSPIYCRLEGFVSYLNGCSCMYMLMMLSIIRYAIVLRTGDAKRHLEQNSLMAVVMCWLLGLVFAVPPLFNWNRYIPEGLGFHCGLDWHDRSLTSRLYFLLTFLFVYFVPLIILFVVNIYVYHRIRRLLYGATISREPSISSPWNLLYMPVPKPSSSSFASLTGSALLTHVRGNHAPPNSVSYAYMHDRRTVCRQMTDALHMRDVIRLKHLKADRRFALATILLVSEYMLSWTPYACVALLHLFAIKFPVREPLLMTICAIIAKLSMIINPFVYVCTIKSNHVKAIVFCEKCSCYNCRVRRTPSDL